MSCVKSTITRFFLSAIIASCVTASLEAAPRSVSYACSPGDALTIARDRSTARVSYAGRIYDLQRKRSDVGLTYLSPKAALVIDGNSAIFVADDHYDLGTCVKGVGLASAN